VARAHSIWIVRDIADGYKRDPIGAFTVKHELVSWLERDEVDPYGLTITVVRDGNLKYSNPLMNEWEVFPQTISAERFLQQARGGQ
jgi:hypothetical protein